MKSLFVPLRSEHFWAFRDGLKTTEFRKFGKRWNAATCAPGRAVVLSLGYSGQRLRGTITSFSVLPLADVLEAEAIYGTEAGRLIACIGIVIDPTT